MSSRALRLAGIIMLAVSLQTSSPAQSADPRDTLAAKLVRDVLQSKEGDVVVVTADASEMRLVDDIALRLRGVGAFAIADVSSNRARKLYYSIVPAKYDGQRPKQMLRLAAIASAFINVNYPYDPSVLEGVPIGRIRAVVDASAPLGDYLLAHNIPVISVGNGIFPSAGTAAHFRVSEQQLSALFWAGVDTDYAQLHRDATRVSRAADGSHSIHITAPNGTDFSFQTLPGSAVMNDGVLSAANRRKGGAALEKQLPGGDVYVRPKPSSANGVIVFGASPSRKGAVVGMTVRFRAGKMTSMHATSGGEPVQEAYDSGSSGRDLFAWADFGVNRSMHLPSGIWGAGPSMVGGYVTAGMGNDLPQGGSNHSTFDFSSSIPDATVAVDGAPIIRHGRLTI